MIKAISQNGTDIWVIDWFKIREAKAGEGFEIIGMARIDLEETEIVTLGWYRYWKQAIEVFGSMDYQSNDLMYYRTHSSVFQLPPAIVDEQECLQIYGSLY